MRLEKNKIYLEGDDYEIAKAMLDNHIKISVDGTGPFGEDEGAYIEGFDPDYSKMANFYEDGQSWDDLDDEEKEAFNSDEDEWAMENPYYADSDIIVLNKTIGQSDCDFTSWDREAENDTIYVDVNYFYKHNCDSQIRNEFSVEEIAQWLMKQYQNADRKALVKDIDKEEKKSNTHYVDYDMEVESFTNYAKRKMINESALEFIPGKIRDKVIRMAAKEIGTDVSEIEYFIEDNESLAKSFEIMRGYGRYDEYDYVREIQLVWNKTMYRDLEESTKINESSDKNIYGDGATIFKPSGADGRFATDRFPICKAIMTNNVKLLKNMMYHGIEDEYDEEPIDFNDEYDREFKDDYALVYKGGWVGDALELMLDYDSEFFLAPFDMLNLIHAGKEACNKKTIKAIVKNYADIAGGDEAESGITWKEMLKMIDEGEID